MNNLLQRALTGLIFVASIVLSIWFSQLIAFCVFSLFFFLAIFEYSNLFKNTADISFNKIGFISFISLAYTLFGLNLFYFWNFQLIFLIIPIILLFVISELWRNKENSINNIASGVFGFVYLLLPFSIILILLNLNTHSNNYLIGMFLLIWTNDTFAYLSGRFFGKTKLFERISPKKTWEGTLGGILFTILVGVLIGLTNQGSEMIFWIISACIIAPCAILGDLLESLMKRNLKIKDSGTILPGHGGVLDRFDAALFTVPFYFSWLIVYQIYS